MLYLDPDKMGDICVLWQNIQKRMSGSSEQKVSGSQEILCLRFCSVGTELIRRQPVYQAPWRTDFNGSVVLLYSLLFSCNCCVLQNSSRSGCCCTTALCCCCCCTDRREWTTPLAGQSLTTAANSTITSLTLDHSHSDDH